MLLGNALIDGRPEPFIMSYNVQTQRSDKIRLLSAYLQDAKQITATGYGPYDNGHLLVGLENGSLLAFDVTNNFECVF